jgi:hypothetical protein
MLEPGKQTMATDKQTAANRLNAQKSTGPKTPEGRAAVRLNGVTHGLTAKTLVLKGESESDFKALFESLEAEHQPTTPTEEILVADLAMAAWRRRRLYNMEAGYYKVRMSNEAEYTREKLDDAGLLGKVASNSGDTMALIGRQEARLERTYYRALHELQRLRKERETELALLSQSPVGQGDAQAGQETNDIQSPPEIALPTRPQPVNGSPQSQPPAGPLRAEADPSTHGKLKTA